MLPQSGILLLGGTTMKKLIYVEMALSLALLVAFSLPSFGENYANMDTMVYLMLAKQVPQPPAQAWKFSIFRTAPLEVAKVFGRTPGCADADADLIQATAKAAIEAGLDPALFAATIGVESGCNPFAISNRGAIGLTQVVPRIWKDTYNFELTYNLLNTADNLHVGATILSRLVAQWGNEGGLHRYNGLGVGCENCDAGYSSKIMLLAGRR